MLKRVRIEVEAATADAAVEELTKYEHAIQTAEAERYGLGYTSSDFVVPAAKWGTPLGERRFYDERLGRELTEEVIEFDPGGPGYRARRVVRFVRIDNRFPHDAVADTEHAVRVERTGDQTG